MGLLDIEEVREFQGLESMFDAENLLGVDTEDMSMLEEMEDEFLQGMETPLTSMAVFDESPMFEPRHDKRVDILDTIGTAEAEDLASKDSAMKMISYLQAQLRAKENEIERLKGTKDSAKAKSETADADAAGNDDFERIVEEAVNAVNNGPEECWSPAPGSNCIEPIVTDACSDDEEETDAGKTETLIKAEPKFEQGPAPTALAELSIKPVPSAATAAKANNASPTTPAATVASSKPAPKASPSNLIGNKRRLDALDLATAPQTDSCDGQDALATKKARLAKTFLGRKIKSEPAPPLPDFSGEGPDESALSKTKKMARRWTPEQDEELRQAVNKHNGQNWKAIARMVDDRDHVQCLQRWKKVLQPGLVKGMWSKEEDDLLLKLMSSSQPKNWADIAAKVPGRTAKQCRERWSLNLDPSINRGAWTQEEDELLLKLHVKLGNRWAEIKRHLNGRTENGVKTRFKSIERARAKDKEVVWTAELEGQLHEIAVRFECRIDEVAKHLPRSLRGISSQAMRDHCPLLRNSEAKSSFLV